MAGFKSGTVGSLAARTVHLIISIAGLIIIWTSDMILWFCMGVMILHSLYSIILLTADLLAIYGYVVLGRRIRLVITTLDGVAAVLLFLAFASLLALAYTLKMDLHACKEVPCNKYAMMAIFSMVCTFLMRIVFFSNHRALVRADFEAAAAAAFGQFPQEFPQEESRLSF